MIRRGTLTPTATPIAILVPLLRPMEAGVEAADVVVEVALALVDDAVLDDDDAGIKLLGRILK